MNKDEYKAELATAHREHDEKLRQIKAEFAESNNTVNIGDVVQDNLGYMKVDRIGASFSGSFPQCVYYGVELTKKLTVMKRQGGRGVWQSNLKN